MSRTTLTDQQIVARITEISSHLKPPIVLKGVTEGDYVNGDLFVAVIGLLKDGNPVHSPKNFTNLIRIREMLVQTFKSIAGKSDVPDFKYQKIKECDPEETLKVLRWIFKIYPPQLSKPTSKDEPRPNNNTIKTDLTHPVKAVAAAFRKAEVPIVRCRDCRCAQGCGYDQANQKSQRAEDSILNMKSLAQAKLPNDTEGLLKLIPKMNMDATEQLMNIATSDPNQEPARIASLRTAFATTTELVVRRRRELERTVRQRQMRSRTAYESYTRNTKSVLEGIEGTIDGRSGNSARRSAILRTQSSRLREPQHSIEEGERLEQSVRSDCVEDSDPQIGYMSYLRSEIARIGAKLESALRAEEVVVKMRRESQAVIDEAHTTHETIPRQIQGLQTDPLTTLYNQRRLMLQLNATLHQNIKHIDEVTRPFIQLSPAPLRDDIDSIRMAICQAITLCDQTRAVIESSISRIEYEAIDRVRGLNPEWTELFNRATKDFSGFPADPQLRCRLLRQLFQAINPRREQLRISYDIVLRHGLDCRLDEQTQTFLKHSLDVTKSYESELTTLQKYDDAVEKYQSVIRDVERHIYGMPNLVRDRLTHACEIERKQIIAEARTECEDDLIRLRRAHNSASDIIRDLRMTIPQHIVDSFNRIHNEYDRQWTS
jgi:hypothetical protein